MFLHKISYVFVFLIFLPIINFLNLKKINIIDLRFLFIFFIMIGLWSIKNYIVTSCFVYPLEFSCLSNPFYELQETAKPANAAWLTEIWAKGFIDHPNWTELNLKEYATSFNWVKTWISGHLLKY